MPPSNQNPLPPEPLVYTIKEAAAALKISTKTVRRLLKRKFLTGSQALRKILIPRKQLEQFLRATCDVPKTAPPDALGGT